MNEINALQLWILFRLHFINEIILNHEFLCKTLSSKTNTLKPEEKENRKEEDREEILKAIENYKELRIPQILLDYDKAVESKQLCNENLGEIKYGNAFGFFKSAWPQNEIQTSILRFFGPMTVIDYYGSIEKGVTVRSGGDVVFTVSTKGELKFFENNKSGNFLIVLNFLFNKGCVPSLGEFMNADFSALIDIAEDVSAE